MAPNLQGGGNREQRVRRPSERQQLINSEQAASSQRRVIDAENRRQREEGIVQPRPQPLIPQHEYTSRVVVRPPSAQRPFQSLVQSRHGSLLPNTPTPQYQPIPSRALNIEQSKELSAYRIARENENDTVSQHSRSFPDNGESTGRGSHMNSQAGDGLAIADVSPQDDSRINPDSAGNKRGRSLSPEIQILHVQQAKKIHNIKGRCCAHDFGYLDEALINKACILYRCMISTENAFPSHLMECEFAQRAWKDTSQCAVQPHPDALKVIMRRGSQMRGEAKAKIRCLIISEYGFRASQSSKSREHNLKRAAAIKEDLNFTYKDLTYCRPNGAVAERKGLYQGLIIQKAINAIWFAHRLDEGVIFPSYFHPFPLQAIALVLTAVECGIDEWISGSHQDINFKSSKYGKTYENHLDMLKVFAVETKEYVIVPKMQIKLSRNGRFSSGAQPLSAVQGPQLSAAAILGAIQDWDDVTESEFSDGHDVEEEE